MANSRQIVWHTEEPPTTVECDYLVTWRERYGDEDWDYNVDCCCYRIEPNVNCYYLGHWEFTWDYDEGQECEVVAWAEMPKPYKEIDDGKDK